jgi:hypothetical protein
MLTDIRGRAENSARPANELGGPGRALTYLTGTVIDTLRWVTG